MSTRATSDFAYRPCGHTTEISATIMSYAEPQALQESGFAPSPNRYPSYCVYADEFVYSPSQRSDSESHPSEEGGDSAHTSPNNSEFHSQEGGDSAHTSLNNMALERAPSMRSLISSDSQMYSAFNSSLNNDDSFSSPATSRVGPSEAPLSGSQYRAPYPPSVRGISALLALPPNVWQPRGCGGGSNQLQSLNLSTLSSMMDSLGSKLESPVSRGKKGGMSNRSFLGETLSQSPTPGSQFDDALAQESLLLCDSTTPRSERLPSRSSPPHKDMNPGASPDITSCPRSQALPAALISPSASKLATNFDRPSPSSKDALLPTSGRSISDFYNLVTDTSRTSRTVHSTSLAGSGISVVQEDSIVSSPKSRMNLMTVPCPETCTPSPASVQKANANPLLKALSSSFVAVTDHELALHARSNASTPVSHGNMNNSNHNSPSNLYIPPQLASPAGYTSPQHALVSAMHFDLLPVGMDVFLNGASCAQNIPPATTPSVAVPYHHSLATPKTVGIQDAQRPLPKQSSGGQVKSNELQEASLTRRPTSENTSTKVAAHRSHKSKSKKVCVSVHAVH